MSTLRHQDDICEVWQGDAREVASSMADGSCSLAILDGPYALGKATWDRQGIDGLPEWYRPHLEDVGRVCAPSASLYVWNTAAGWARLDPLIRSMGWTWRALVTWDKTIAHMAGRVDTAGLRTWFDLTEVCGFYQRESPSPFPDLLTRRRQIAGLTRKDLAALFPSRTGGLTGCVLNWESGYNVPTKGQWVSMMERIQTEGAGTVPVLSGSEYDHLRAEYEASRPPFECPMGVGNVWTHGPVAGSERLRGPNGATLHPCQKPVLFARRMIEASTRPGDRVWVPFGGTLRECIAARDIARESAESARYVVTSELNADGPDYIGAALRQYHGEGTRPVDPKQGRLFATIQQS